MKLSAILCNHAEVQNNLLFINGGGVDRALVPPGAPPPWPVVLSIGMVITVPWTQTNQQHKVHIELIDEDGQQVQVATRPSGESAPFAADLGFNVGRPPVLGVGDDQHVALAVNMPGLPFTKLGRYRFVIQIDGTDMEELSYVVAPVPGVTIGPTALPSMQ